MPGSLRNALRIFIGAVIASSTFWAFFLYTPVEPPKGKTVVTFAVWGGVSERRAWDILIKDFESKHPDIKVDLQLVPLKYGEKMLTLLAANIAPDMLNVPIADMVPKGVLRPIDDFLAKDTAFRPERFIDNVWELTRVNGHYYDVSASIGPLALFYNIKHFKEAGLKTPNEYAAEGTWNWDTFLGVCKRLVKRDQGGRVTRWAYRIYAEYMIWEYIAANGGAAFGEDFKHCNFDDPRVYEALQRLADLSLVHGVSPPVIAEEQSGIVSSWMEFKRGNVSMMDSGPWMLGRLKGMEDPYDVAPPPMEPGGRAVLGYGGVTGIWSKSKHPWETYLWQSYLWTEDSRIIWSRLGFDIPALKSLVEHKERWLDTATAPKHFGVFYELAGPALQKPFSIMPALPKKAGDLVYKTVWETIRLGNKSARQALKDAQPELELVLARGW
jgi:multiple sugar transport system substrate-binding protein